MSLNIPVQAKVWLKSTFRDPGQLLRKRDRFKCPCCGYEGHFATANRKYPVPFRCPNCESRPRDRQIFLWLKRNNVSLKGRKVLNFAPEWPMFRLLKNEPGYVGGDVQVRKNATAIVDITCINFPNAHFDYLVCNHVLEHVPDDKRAMQECARVMKTGGTGIFTVPVADQNETWEPPTGMSVQDIEKICGWDHKRLYGRDFKSKLEAVGFSVDEFSCTQAERREFCLADDTIYIATRKAD